MTEKTSSVQHPESPEPAIILHTVGSHDDVYSGKELSLWGAIVLLQKIRMLKYILYNFG
jgi:hypothetical protein